MVTSGRDRITAVANASLSVDTGTSLAIIGSSGSGKSSVLELMGGLSNPTTGTVTFRGRDISRLTGAARRAFRRRHVGFVFQNANVIEHLSVQDNVALPLRYQGVGRTTRRARAERWLAAVGLADRADMPVARLSGGERQRVAIARALVTDPELVLADEPTGSLDQKTGNDIMTLLTGLMTGQRTLVVVTHDTQHLSRFGRVVEMAFGAMSEVQNAPLAGRS